MKILAHCIFFVHFAVPWSTVCHQELLSQRSPSGSSEQGEKQGRVGRITDETQRAASHSPGRSRGGPERKTHAKGSVERANGFGKAWDRSRKGRCILTPLLEATTETTQTSTHMDRGI